MHRRLLNRALMYVLLGAALQTLVAWLLMLYMPVPMDPYRTSLIEPLSSFARLAPPEWGRPSRCIAFPRGVGTRYYQMHWGESVDPRHMLHQYECGIPFRSFTGGGCGDFPVSNSRGVVWTVALRELPRWAYPPQWMWGKDTVYACQIVYLPLWDGLALNTALFAALLWVVHGSVVALRKSRRIRAGRCIHCGYPLGHLPQCPECGRLATVKTAEGPAS